MMLLKFWKELLIALLFTAATGVFLYINHLKLELIAANKQNERQELRIRDLNIQLKDITDNYDVLKQRFVQSEVERNKIKQERDVALNKLRAQRPPVKCEDAVKWSVDRKDDLKW